MRYITVIFVIASLLGIPGCNSDEQLSDAFGNFEAETVMVSSQAQGKLIFLDIEEGKVMNAGEIAGIVDTMQLSLRKDQLKAAKMTAATKINTIGAQAEALQVQIDNAAREYQRILKLSEDGAATEKQRDDLEGNINLLNAQRNSIESQKATVYAEVKSFDVQLLQVNDQIEKSIIKNPITGTVLQKYKRFGEITAPGQIIYKIADIDHLFLRAYISGNQLPLVVIGEEVTVRIDDTEGVIEMPGRVSWIASTAEFTPKVIQTREERVNLVYAMKIKVKNDGRLKIGMPGEVVF